MAASFTRYLMPCHRHFDVKTMYCASNLRTAETGYSGKDLQYQDDLKALEEKGVISCLCFQKYADQGSHDGWTVS